MKRISILTLTACLLAFALPGTALAGAGNKGDKAARRAERKEKRQTLTQYDKDSSGKLEGEERDALRKAFETDTTLKFLDKNSDGKLDESEIDVLKTPQRKGAGKAGKAGRAGKGGKAGRKKNQ